MCGARWLMDVFRWQRALGPLPCDPGVTRGTLTVIVDDVSENAQVEQGKPGNRQRQQRKQQNHTQQQHRESEGSTKRETGSVLCDPPSATVIIRPVTGEIRVWRCHRVIDGGASLENSNASLNEEIDSNDGGDGESSGFDAVHVAPLFAAGDLGMLSMGGSHARRLELAMDALLSLTRAFVCAGNVSIIVAVFFSPSSPMH